MYQLTFSDQSMGELKKLGTLEQLPLVDALSSVTPERLATDRTELGVFNREDKTYYRLRVGEYRIYFEVVKEDEIHCYHILHKHSVADFAFRMGLREQDEAEIEKDQTFWKYVLTSFRK